jgi:hypothetical protein
MLTKSWLTQRSALSLLDYHSPDNTGNGAIRCQSDDYPVITPIELSRDAALMSQYFLPGGPIPVAQVSPFILHLQYQACIILSNEVKNPGREEDIRRLSILRESLVHLRGRWLAAGESLNRSSVKLDLTYLVI